MNRNRVPRLLLATDQSGNDSTNKKKSNARHVLSVFIVVSTTVFIYSRVTLVVSWIDLTGDRNHSQRGQILGRHVTYCLNSPGIRWENMQAAMMLIGQTVRCMVICLTEDHGVYDFVGKDSNDNRSG